tara:strand:- start:98686 stop:99183 length:498 start_codon:yes stop_codon:yes gene_type:complete
MFRVLGLVVSILFLSASIASAQCPRPYDVFEADYDNGWGDNSQSKSGPLRPGDSYEMKFIAQGGMKYRVSVASGNEQFSKENVEFQLVGSEVRKVKENGKMIYKRVDVVFYDSEESKEGQKAEVFSTRTKRLKVRIKLKGAEDSKLMQCVVVFIETKRPEALGLK